MRQGPLFTTAALCGLALIAASPAAAKCTRLAFSVNDYGKPIEDAKNMLDKYIAKTMAEKGVSKYRTGKKDVNCEFFITLLVVDEYTCRAEADVCWDEGPAAGAAQQAKAAPAGDAKKADAKKAAGPETAASPAPRKEAAAPATPAPAKESAAPAPPATGPVKTVDTPLSSGEGLEPEENTAAAPSDVPAVEAEAAPSPANEARAPENAESAAHSPAADAASPSLSAEAPASAGEGTPPVTETGAVERFAAPKKIVIPEPIQVKRGIPVGPKTAAPEEPTAP